MPSNSNRAEGAEAPSVRVGRFTNEEGVKYQPMFNNARKIRDVVSHLHDVSLELVEPAAASPRPKILTAAKATSPKTSQPRTRNVAKG